MSDTSEEKKLSKVNETLNATLLELNQTKAELERVTNIANEYAKQVNIYRSALLQLAKEINM